MGENVLVTKGTLNDGNVDQADGWLVVRVFGEAHQW